MLNPLQKVLFECFKFSRKSIQPTSPHLVLLQILLPQWTVSDTVIFTCKTKRREDISTKAGEENWQCQFWSVWRHSLGYPQGRRRKDTRWWALTKCLAAEYSFFFHLFLRCKAERKFRPHLTAYLKSLPLPTSPQHFSYRVMTAGFLILLFSLQWVSQE